MKTALLVIGNATSPELLKDSVAAADTLIGVDKGAFVLAKAHIKMDVAVGDFDSISKEQLALVKEWSSVMVTLNPIKDDTDTEHAVGLAKDAERIVILGGIQGKRIEHFLANLALLRRNPKVEILDDYSRVFTLSEGTYEFKEGDPYRFISLFAIEKAEVSLQGFAYDSPKLVLLPEDVIGVSNERKENLAVLRVLSGRVFVILSKKD